MVSFRLLFLLNAHRLEEFDALLRCPPERIHRGSLDYSGRLECLACRLMLDGQVPRAVPVLEAALEKLKEAPPGPEAMYSRAAALAWLAWSEVECGNMTRAARLIDEAEAIAKPFALSLRMTVNGIRGTIHYHLGEYDTAFRIHMKSCLSTKGVNDHTLIRIAQACLNAAKCALRAERRDVARRLLARAERIVDRLPHVPPRGYVELARGDIGRGAGTRAGYQAARAAYQRAEDIFRESGPSHRWWLAQVHLGRAGLFLRERRFADALRETGASMKIGVEKNSFDIQGESILLQSYLLLHEEGQRLDLYEQILRRLGAIRNPLVLFKVLANLYIYSWDLGEHIDLTAHHLKQVEAMRGIIPDVVFDRLYAQYVTERVMLRFRKRFQLDDGGMRRAVDY
jgi:tetratricopeptide (TPR) repeat protein